MQFIKRISVTLYCVSVKVLHIAPLIFSLKSSVSNFNKDTSHYPDLLLKTSEMGVKKYTVNGLDRTTTPLIQKTTCLVATVASCSIKAAADGEIGTAETCATYFMLRNHPLMVLFDSQRLSWWMFALTV